MAEQGRFTSRSGSCLEIQAVQMSLFGCPGQPSKPAGRSQAVAPQPVARYVCRTASVVIGRAGAAVSISLRIETSPPRTAGASRRPSFLREVSALRTPFVSHEGCSSRGIRPGSQLLLASFLLGFFEEIRSYFLPRCFMIRFLSRSAVSESR